MSQNPRYTLIEVVEGTVPTEYAVKQLINYVDKDKQECRPALEQLLLAFHEDEGHDQTSVMNALVTNNILIKVVNVINSEADGDTKLAAVNLLSAMLSEGFASGANADDIDTSIGDLLMVAAISPNELLAKYGTQALIAWASAGAEQLDALSNTLLLIACPILLTNELPSSLRPCLAHLRKRMRILRVLSALVRAKLEWRTIGQAVHATERVKAQCEEQTQPETEEEQWVWEDLDVAAYEFLLRASNAGFSSHTELDDPLADALLENAQLRMELETARKDNDELRWELDRLKCGANGLVTGVITDLEEATYFFGENTQLVREGNTITNNGDQYSSDSCLIAPVFTGGVHRITFKTPENPYVHLGVCDPSLGLPRRGFKFSRAGKGLDVTLKYGEIRNKNSSTVGYISKMQKDDTIALELDLRETDPQQRILRFFVNGRAQKVFVSGLPESVQVGCTLEGGHRQIEFVSLEELSTTTVHSVDGERVVPFVHGDKETVEEATPVVLSSRTTLASLDLHFSDSAKIVAEANSFVRQGEKSYETVFFTQPLATGVHRLSFKVITMVDFLYCGVIDASLGYPASGEDMSFPHKGVEYRLSGGTLWEQRNIRVGSDKSAKEGDIVAMELDLRSEEKEKRTIRWFINGVQYNYFIFNVPASVQLGFCMYSPGKSIEFLSLDELQEPTNRPKADEVGHPFEGDQD